MRKLFGTDGIRGTANVYPMTAEVALRLGRALAYVIKNSQRRHRIVVGKDTRISGYILEYAITAGICSMGVDVLLLGPLPTPGIAFITHSMRADAGVVISASHNPYQDNGIKLFSGQGFKFPDELEARMETLMAGSEVENCCPTATEVGQAFRIDDARGRYIAYLKSTFPKELSLDGLKIVLDCAHGATYRVAPAVLEELGANLITIGVKPNGKNINHNCGSTHPEMISSLVKRNQADLGLALDGDGDRVIMVDHRGRLIDGDHLMAICAGSMLKAGTLHKKTVVTTVMSNMGLEVALKRMGGRLVRTMVGDRYVVETMIQMGCNLGGEQSGHLIFRDHSTTGDGILSALQLLTVMQREQKSLAELASVMEVYPQTLLNVRVREKRDLSEVPPVIQGIRAAEKALGGRGRLLIRYSGTEPLLRVMCEGEDSQEVETIAQEVAALIQTHLN
ncbi:MAG: phosphoglucosamine mutase [Deltaproteobacteria bacterium]|nr:phosphoglucosamine mutase [Deltaproteobacteria bacterium]MBW1985715.1 phosphoglucosamine mutase [Deltaproteobacteria bacterium]MBW2134629.1 phosphoglucosamine mutase [Deltaproteobacteria bacterium]